MNLLSRRTQPGALGISAAIVALLGLFLMGGTASAQNPPGGSTWIVCPGGQVVPREPCPASTHTCPDGTVLPADMPCQSEEPAPEPTGNATAIIAGTGGDGANCRSGPNGNSNVITSLAEGEVVALNGEAFKGWQPVLCGGHRGYVAVDFVTAHGDGVQCRAGASDASRLIAVLPQGSTVTIIGEPVNGWQPVVCGGRNGHVSLESIESGYLLVAGQS